MVTWQAALVKQARLFCSCYVDGLSTTLLLISNFCADIPLYSTVFLGFYPRGGGTWPTNIPGRAAGKSKKLPCPGIKYPKLIPCPGEKFS